MSAARERVGVEPDDAEAKRAAMIGEGNRVSRLSVTACEDTLHSRLG